MSRRELLRVLVHAPRGGAYHARTLAPLVERLSEEEVRALLEVVRNIEDDARREGERRAVRRGMTRPF